MRKYFLLSAVALLAASNANAGTSYTEITVNAMITAVSNQSCSSLELGVIYVEEANTSHTTGVASYSVTNSGAVDIEGPILKVDNAQRAKCNISSGGTATVNIPETIELCNHKGEYCMPVDLNYNIDEDGKFLYIGADVTVPEGVLNSAIYTGSFGMWYIY